MGRFLHPKLKGELKMAKTNVEKIESIRAEIQQLKNREKQLLQQQKEDERKARTHRLIERGGLLESLMGVAEDVTNEEIKEVLAIALNGDEARKALLALRTRQTAESVAAADTSPGGGA